MLFFSSVVTDLKYLRWYETIFLIIFASALVVFSFIDFNAIKPDADPNMSIWKWTNDKNNGYELWERVISALSGVASFTGAMTVVMTAKGLYSLFFWGYINVVLYGTYAFVYGYTGDAQLNIMFYLPLMIYGQFRWFHNMKGPVVRMRFMNPLKWFLALSLCVGLGFAFYYEIPEFSKAIEGYYVFEDDEIPHRLDAISNALSILGQILLNGRYMEQWLFWITSNCIQIAMYAGVAGFGQDINILLMFSLFQLNALRGLYVWFSTNYNYWKKRKGLIVGKFYPFHNGHKALIEYGLANCDVLSVVIIYKDDETVSGTARYNMIKETFKDEINNHRLDLQMRKDTWNRDDDSAFWAKKALEFMDGFRPNVVFTSENYGDQWAGFIGCQHMMFDKKRERNFISGTIVRKNPYASWEHLPAATRNYYRIKLVFVGAESTGKTTMAKKIANKYNIPYVKEHARDYIQNSDRKTNHVDANGDTFITMNFMAKDFENIAKKQEEEISKACNTDSPIVVCDTDGFVTHYWMNRYLDYDRNVRSFKRIEKLLKSYSRDNTRYYVVSLIDENTPFVQDGMRDGEYARLAMDSLIKSDILSSTLPYTFLSGTYENRERQLEKIVSSYINPEVDLSDEMSNDVFEN